MLSSSEIRLWSIQPSTESSLEMRDVARMSSGICKSDFAPLSAILRPCPNRHCLEILDIAPWIWFDAKMEEKENVLLGEMIPVWVAWWLHRNGGERERVSRTGRAEMGGKERGWAFTGWESAGYVLSSGEWKLSWLINKV